METYKLYFNILNTKIELWDINNSAIEIEWEWVDALVKNWFLQKSIWEDPLKLWDFLIQIIYTFLEQWKIEEIIEQKILWDEIDFSITLSDKIKNISIFTLPNNKEYNTKDIMLYFLKNTLLKDREQATMMAIWIFANVNDSSEIMNDEEEVLKKATKTLHELLLVEKK